MRTQLADLNAFVAVANAGGFREAARATGGSASGLSEAVRRLEARLGVRLFNRTTRTVVTTEAGQSLLERLAPALREIEAALDVVNGFRNRPAGTLRLNVPVSAARLVLPGIIPGFLAAFPEIRLEVIAEDGGARGWRDERESDRGGGVGGVVGGAGASTAARRHRQGRRRRHAAQTSQG